MQGNFLPYIACVGAIRQQRAQQRKRQADGVIQRIDVSSVRNESHYMVNT